MYINHKYKMNNGRKIPAFGLGTYKMQTDRQTYNAVSYALEIGYRHFDTAAMYQNEEEVGKAVNDSDVDRQDVFITTKVWNTDQGYNNTLKAFSKSLEKLKTDYVDLYLIHWPEPDKRLETWKALMKLYEEGKAKAIGVSNFTINHLEELIDEYDFTPAVNQVEFSPFLYQKDLLNYCRERNIILEAYSPLTRGKKFGHTLLKELADKYQKTAAQILIRWALQHELVVIPKSSHKNRIMENADVFNFNIEDDDMDRMDNIRESFRIAWDPTGTP
ncbi:MAG: aldo/keto reductase [Candidatus Kapaibacterium sp.]